MQDPLIPLSLSLPPSDEREVHTLSMTPQQSLSALSHPVGGNGGFALCGVDRPLEDNNRENNQNIRIYDNDDLCSLVL